MKRIAVIGATGAVGRKMVQELESLDVPCKLGLFASPRSAGKEISFHDKPVKVEVFNLAKLADYDVALMSAGGGFSREHAQEIAAQNVVVIDNSSAWRMVEGVPLIVPEVNGAEISGLKKGIIANPNCSTIQMVVSLKPLADQFGLQSVNVCTYQSVSGSGQNGIAELRSQLTAFHQGEEPQPELYAKPIFNNVIPAIDVLQQDGHCFEEEKMISETRKILGDKNLSVLATTARVPVMSCHSESITVTLNQQVERAQVLKAFESQAGLKTSGSDSYDDFPYPLDIKGRRDVYVGRVRLPLGETKSSIVQYWNVADNLMKGAATNAVQILKLL